MTPKTKRRLVAATATGALLLAGCSMDQGNYEDQQVRASRIVGSPPRAISNLIDEGGFSCQEIMETDLWYGLRTGRPDPEASWTTLALAFMACPNPEWVLDKLEEGKR